MTANQQTYQQIERALRKVASKFSLNNEQLPLTDLYLQVKQESGELRIYDDDDNEITRCVIEEWIGNNDERFYSNIQPILIAVIQQIKDVTENIAIIKPYSFVLIGEDHETIADLYLVDDDTMLISGELMEGLSKDLDNFWDKLEEENYNADDEYTLYISISAFVWHAFAACSTKGYALPSAATSSSGTEQRPICVW